MKVQLYRPRTGAGNVGVGGGGDREDTIRGEDGFPAGDLIESSTVAWSYERRLEVGAGSDADLGAAGRAEKCVSKGSNAVMVSKFPKDGHFSEDWLFALAAGSWVVRVDVPYPYCAHPVRATNILLFIDSVWPQNLAYWEDVGSYICRLRSGLQNKLTVVLLGDEYYQAPRFLYSQADYMFKSYVSPQQAEFPHVMSIPLGYKRGFWREIPGAGGGDVHAPRWVDGYVADERLLTLQRPHVWNFIGNALASQVTSARVCVCRVRVCAQL